MHTQAGHLAQLGEPRRMRVLARLDLDHPELGRRLDAISERTARHLGQPIGMVSLVLDTALVLAGSHGITGWVLESGGTPVEWAFCAHTVAGRRPYIITDASRDPVHAGNPLVAVEGARSYAGVPLEIDGEVLGAHCVVGGAAHTFTDDDIDELRRGAEEAVVVLEQYRLAD